MHGIFDSGLLYKNGGGLKIKKILLAVFLYDGVPTFLRTDFWGVPRPISGGVKKNLLVLPYRGSVITS